MDTNVERLCLAKEITENFGVSRDMVLNWIEKRNMPAAKDRAPLEIQNQRS